MSELPRAAHAAHRAVFAELSRRHVPQVAPQADVEAVAALGLAAGARRAAVRAAGLQIPPVAARQLPGVLGAHRLGRAVVGEAVCCATGGADMSGIDIQPDNRLQRSAPQPGLSSFKTVAFAPTDEHQHEREPQHEDG